MTRGERIRQLRIAAKFTQADVGRAVGVSSQAVSKWENDASEPDGSAILILCRLFDVTADELLGADHTETPPDPDDDVWALREQLRRDPERRTLFAAAKHVRKEDILTAVRILDALKGDDDGDAL